MLNRKIYSKLFAIIITIAVLSFRFIIGCGGYITEPPDHWGEDLTDREYEYIIPSTNSPENPSPILFVFHGAQSSPMSMRYAARFDDYAEENNLIIIYPVGVSGWWNLHDDCSSIVLGANKNDFGFVDYLISKFNEEYSIDNDRIYATGFSLGAMFTMTYALEKPNVFAAIAPLAGPLRISTRYKFDDAESIPIMYLHGTLDNWDGGGDGHCERFAVPDYVELIANLNGCDQNPTIEHLPDTGEDYIHVTRNIYNNCSGNAETIFVKVEGGIHEWFDFKEFNATETIIEFLLKHSL